MGHIWQIDAKVPDRPGRWRSQLPLRQILRVGIDALLQTRTPERPVSVATRHYSSTGIPYFSAYRERHPRFPFFEIDWRVLCQVKKARKTSVGKVMSERDTPIMGVLTCV